MLRGKWGEVPFSQWERRFSSDLLQLPDAELLEQWQEACTATSTGTGFAVRGWYQTLYRDIFRGKKVLDVGCGLGPDTVFYAVHGAKVTFTDVVEPNVRFVERVCRLKGIRDASFLFVKDISSLDELPRDYDFIYCCGSFILAPLEVARIEAQALLEHLPVGSRWIELGYPRARWERAGRPPETDWGRMTDGGAPWIEWHDVEKLDYLFFPATFDVVLYQEFHNSDFNWFDMVRRS